MNSEQTKTATRLLQEAQAEIKLLRRVNEILQAKVSTMELFATVLHTQPAYPHQVISEDITFKIAQWLENLPSTEGQSR